MLASLIVALMAADVPMSADLPAGEPLRTSSACASGEPRDLVQVRVFPIGFVRRVFPSANEIMEKGGDAAMVRGFWQAMMSAICDPRLPDADIASGEFSPRIVVFVAGEEDREPILIEYPDWGDSPAPVRALVNGRMVTMPAAVVRKLLDYSRGGWRD